MRKRGFRWHLLFFLSILADFYKACSPRTIYILAYTNYSIDSFSKSLRELAKIKAISKEIVDGEPVIRLETRGVGLLNELISLKKFQEEPWWGYWTVVMFDIPEKIRIRRDILRKKMYSLGFGQWQRSVYISPHPLVEEIDEFLEAEGLWRWTYCFQAKNIGGLSDKDLAEVVFPLEDLREEYEDLARQIEGFLDKDWENLEKNTISASVYDFVNKYFSLLEKDPFVPIDIVGDDLGRGKVEELIGEIYEKFSEEFEEE